MLGSLFGGGSIVNLIFTLLSMVPVVKTDIEAAAKEHWGKDHFAQVQHGLSVLAKISADAATVATGCTVAAAPVDPAAPVPLKASA
jgi:hypothetical protein